MTELVSLMGAGPTESMLMRVSSDILYSEFR